MKKILSFLAAGLMVLSLHATQSNFIKNGKFSQGNKFWQLSPAEKNAITIDNADFISSNNSVCLSHKNKVKRESYISQKIKLNPFSQYNLSFWLKTDATGIGRVSIVENGSALFAGETLRTRNKWQKYTIPFQTSQKGDIDILLRMSLRNTAGNVWFDDIQVSNAKGSYTGKDGFKNIALNKTYKLSPAPSYKLCTDVNDKTQLTDGKLTTGYFWAQKSTVGWWRIGDKPAVITLDLEKTEPISGVAFSTAARLKGGVKMPSSIMVEVSEDGKKFFPVGDLAIDLSDTEIPKGLDGYHTYTYRASKLKTKGRYVRFSVLGPRGTMFCDEIEIYQGPNELLKMELTGTSRGSTKLTKTMLVNLGVKKQLIADWHQLNKIIKNSKIGNNEKQTLLKKANKLKLKVQSYSFKGNPLKFKAIVPLNQVHRDVLSLYAELLRAEKLPVFSVWHKYRYAPLSVFEHPEKSCPSLKVRMLRNEHRSETLNFSNLAGKAVNVKFQISGIPKNIIKAFKVEYVGSRENKVVATALIPLLPKNKFWETSVPSGMTRQIWFDFYPKNTATGKYSGKIKVICGKITKNIPITLNLSKYALPAKTALKTGIWAYTCMNYCAVTPKTHDYAVQDLKDHLINAPWLRSDVPEKECLDAQGNVVRIKTAKFDKWMQEYPNSARYNIFFPVRPHAVKGSKLPHTIAGFKRGTKEFKKAVSQWAKLWENHAKKKGLTKGQLSILFVDEPLKPIQYQTTKDWTEAFKNGTDYVTLWCDFSLSPENDTLFAQNKKIAFDSIKNCDYFCPSLKEFRNLKATRDLYKQLNKNKNKELQFYMCAGPNRHFDPSYFRLQPWHCFAQDAVGSHFWAYSDTGGNSWNEYLDPNSRGSFALIYATPDTITTTKHWEGLREGIQDYRYLEMLNKKSKNKGKKLTKDMLKKAEKVTKYKYTVQWAENTPCELADQTRLKILDEIEK